MKKNNIFIFFSSVLLYLFFCFGSVLAMEKSSFRKVPDIDLSEGDCSLECFDLNENRNLAPYDVGKVLLHEVKNFLYYENLNKYFKYVYLSEHEFFKKLFEYYANNVLEKYYSPKYKDYERFSGRKKVACEVLKNFKDFLIKNAFIQDSFKIKIRKVESEWLELLSKIIKVFNDFKAEEDYFYLVNSEEASVLYAYFLFIREFVKYVNNNCSQIRNLYKKFVV